MAECAPRPRALRGHPNLSFRQMTAEGVPLAASIETRSYPEDEAATPAMLEYRQRVAPELFYGVHDGDSKALVAFIVSTAAEGALEEETMSVHVPGGSSICIHSVAVDPDWRRKGIARAMVRTYVDTVAADSRCASAKRMLLIAKANLLGLYAQCGFELLGPSSVVHGADLWFDMRLELRQWELMQVDAFTPVAFSGNPAAVLFTQRSGDEDWMQAVAAENNLAETAYLERRDEEGEWDIRWFTPTTEVDLCGHATLAAAHALWATNRVGAEKCVTFHTRRAGTLRCIPSAPWIRMDFPEQLPTSAFAEAPVAELAGAFGLAAEDVLCLRLGPPTTPDWLIELTPENFQRLAPDLSALKRVKPMERGVIVTCAGYRLGERRPRVLRGATEESFDFVSRFFAPCKGIDEDPVTGSAHCLLAPYWAQKLGRADGEWMAALQASARGGLLRVSLRTDADGARRVDIEGQAVTVLRGSFAT